MVRIANILSKTEGIATETGERLGHGEAFWREVHYNSMQILADRLREYSWGKGLRQKDATFINDVIKYVDVMANALFLLREEMKELDGINELPERGKLKFHRDNLSDELITEDDAQ